MSETINLNIAPHADVRIICQELGKTNAGLASLGFNAPAIDAAIDMLVRLSEEVEAWRTGERKFEDRT